MKTLFRFPHSAVFALPVSLWSAFARRICPAPAPRRRLRRLRPCLELLEDRTLLSAYVAADVSSLIADINAANKQGGASTITLTTPTTSPYILSAVNNATNGANGLPVIGGSKAVNLTIIGNADTIERSTATGAPAFRLFDVAGGSSLTLESVTLQNGVARGAGAAADGGAIFNQGSVTLVGATLQDNAAVGSNGADGLVTQATRKTTQSSSLNGQAGGNAAGGGIWSSGSVTLEGGTILQQNQALGGQGGVGGMAVNGSTVVYAGNGGAGGGGLGGGLCEAGGSVNVTNATLAGNTAAGGAGGHPYIGVAFSANAGVGGIGAGGGMYAAAGTLHVSSVIVQANQALGGTGGEWGLYGGGGGVAYGGGIDVAGGTATLAGSQLLSNQAVGGTGGFDAGYYGGNGGNAFGGGLYAGGGTLTLTNDTVTGNDALGGSTGQTDNTDSVLESSLPNPGTGAGGGIEIASAATVSLDSFTVNDTTSNYGYVRFDWGYEVVTSNIDGKYILL